VCAMPQSERQHQPMTRDEWRSETNQQWVRDGSAPHEFQPSDWRRPISNAVMCAVCALTETTNGQHVHHPTRIWAHRVYLQWLENGRKRHLWVESEYHVNDDGSGVALCLECAQELDATRAYHIIIERIQPPAPVEYQPIVRRRRDINI
jgi:hypothetical protein